MKMSLRKIHSQEKKENYVHLHIYEQSFLLSIKSSEQGKWKGMSGRNTFDECWQGCNSLSKPEPEEADSGE